MKLGSVPKLDKKKQNNVKKIDDNVMSENCNVITIFTITVNSEQWIDCNWKNEPTHHLKMNP